MIPDKLFVDYSSANLASKPAEDHGYPQQRPPGQLTTSQDDLRISAVPSTDSCLLDSFEARRYWLAFTTKTQASFLTCVTEYPAPVIEQSNRQLLMELLRSERNAERLSHVPIEELSMSTWRELGISRAAYRRLLAGIELGRRVSEASSQYNKPAVLNSTAAAIDFCRVHFARLITDAVQEQFHSISLNSKLGVIRTNQITVGTLDSALIHPREIFRTAIRDAASSIIVVHNHPSGDPEPSREDREVTKRLTDVGELIGIRVLDHIVVGKSGIVSVREHGTR